MHDIRELGTFIASGNEQKGMQCSLTPSIPKNTESAPRASTSQSYSTATPLDSTTLPPAWHSRCCCSTPRLVLRDNIVLSRSERFVLWHPHEACNNMWSCVAYAGGQFSKFHVEHVACLACCLQTLLMPCVTPQASHEALPELRAVTVLCSSSSSTACTLPCANTGP